MGLDKVGRPPLDLLSHLSVCVMVSQHLRSTQTVFSPSLDVSLSHPSLPRSSPPFLLSLSPLSLSPSPFPLSLTPLPSSLSHPSLSHPSPLLPSFLFLPPLLSPSLPLPSLLLPPFSLVVNIPGFPTLVFCM